MEALLSEVSMGLGSAYASYLVKIIMYTAVAAIGIFAGIKLRKNKNKKQSEEKK